MAKTRYHVPVLVIGSGLAGCSAALTLADAGHEVLIISESDHLGDWVMLPLYVAVPVLAASM